MRRNGRHGTSSNSWHLVDHVYGSNPWSWRWLAGDDLISFFFSPSFLPKMLIFLFSIFCFCCFVFGVFFLSSVFHFLFFLGGGGGARDGCSKCVYYLSFLSKHRRRTLASLRTCQNRALRTECIVRTATGSPWGDCGGWLSVKHQHLTKYVMYRTLWSGQLQLNVCTSLKTGCNYQYLYVGEGEKEKKKYSN